MAYEPRSAVKQRKAKAERSQFEAKRSTPDPFAQMANDIMGGGAELLRQGKAAAETIKSGFRKVKRFLDH